MVVFDYQKPIELISCKKTCNYLQTEHRMFTPFYKNLIIASDWVAYMLKTYGARLFEISIGTQSFYKTHIWIQADTYPEIKDFIFLDKEHTTMFELIDKKVEEYIQTYLEETGEYNTVLEVHVSEQFINDLEEVPNTDEKYYDKLYYSDPINLYTITDPSYNREVIFIESPYREIFIQNIKRNKELSL